MKHSMKFNYHFGTDQSKVFFYVRKIARQQQQIEKIETILYDISSDSYAARLFPLGNERSTFYMLS